ncbi:fumarylacetoacetate hydrolase family protein [Saccharopolyspora dendranthemae]|uniref:2-keto-4-pentenoate hydratase/2-oxohepta-3-ene-1,7-dioic acid hydratase in catechol pathway n=1 Tax=Saccharopolyspora dendranthemae TaxID=1181886 RepID=A0A561U813_9PSEU|nr:fumarylacetoacetate hydrolase family protein [Saccharopolyspora dendranthemae]TWF95502.1 2-keto-4-pentenoate hydratase/2-oxohepta-3-ene-1,7-dioic acid hydratase in catechol pathway [Saccharopolyspora dendranthemae]
MTRWVDGYALGTFSDGSREFAGLVSGDRVLPLDEAGTVRDLLEDWDAVRARLPELAATLGGGGGRPLGELSVRAPVVPRQIIQAGANYRSHVAEIVLSGREPDDARSDDELRREAEKMMDDKARTGSPFFFAGLPAAICGPDDDVLLPAESSKVDWEVELTAVIGKTAHRVPRERALEHVAGFTACNDISARDLQFPPEHRPLGGDWIRAKNRPTFLPTGPFITPVEVLGDYRDLQITLDLNGERKQSDVPANLLFDVEAIIAAASAATTLYPGDLVLTGSPAGNGGKWQRWLEPGDVLEAAISGIGAQRNTCVQEPR